MMSVSYHDKTDCQYLVFDELKEFYHYGFRNTLNKVNTSSVPNRGLLPIGKGRRPVLAGCFRLLVLGEGKRPLLPINLISFSGEVFLKRYSNLMPWIGFIDPANPVLLLYGRDTDSLLLCACNQCLAH